MYIVRFGSTESKKYKEFETLDDAQTFSAGLMEAFIMSEGEKIAGYTRCNAFHSGIVFGDKDTYFFDIKEDVDGKAVFYDAENGGVKEDIYLTI